jgi:hypothetical protein
MVLLLEELACTIIATPAAELVVRGDVGASPHEE